MSAPNIEDLLHSLDKTRRKKKQSMKIINQSMDKLIEDLETGIKEVDAAGRMEDEAANIQMRDAVQRVCGNIVQDKPFKKVVDAHQEYYGFVSNFGKNIDKFFVRDIDQTHINAELENNLVKELILEHLLKNGAMESVTAFEEESNMRIDMMLKAKLEETALILQEIKRKNLRPAISWADDNTADLIKIKSNLKFELHKTQYLQLLKDQGRQTAVEYAQNYFPLFMGENRLEVQRLMTSILFLGTDKSYYSDLFDEKNWEKIAQSFLVDSCKIMGSPSSSLISILVSAGTKALPKFIKYASLNQNAVWREKNEIPIEVDIGNDFKFHSIFVCPVSREAEGPESQPILLKCGHVLSKHSFDRLSQSRNRLKCPVCPREIVKDEVKPIKF